MANKIPDEVYEKILEYSVISAVDGIIFHNGKVLLAKRTQEPCKGEWWIPGGKQNKNELPEDAVKRKIKNEIGIDVKVEKMIGVYDVMFDKTAFPNVKTGVHYVARVYVVTPVNLEIKLDSTQKEYRWINRVEEGLHDYVKTALRDSKVFENLSQ